MPTVTSIMADLKNHPMLAHCRGAGGIESEISQRIGWEV